MEERKHFHVKTSVIFFAVSAIGDVSKPCKANNNGGDDREAKKTSTEFR